MTTHKSPIMKLVIVLFLVCLLSIQFATAKAASSDPPQAPPGAAMNGNGEIIPADFQNTEAHRSNEKDPVPLGPGLPGTDISTPDVTPAEEMVSVNALAATKLATPVLISPANGTKFNHYPRTTTLAWKPVTGATGYLLERQYCSGSLCWPFPTVTITTKTGTYYTFTFVGSQPGKWRVSAFDATGAYTPSSNSTWRIFDYTTKYTKLATPVLTSPLNNTFFYNYPRETTVAWNPVPGAASYLLERQYYGGGWYSFPQVTTTSASYTFTFVGAQPGQWRVTAQPASGLPFQNSNPSAWRLFTYTV